MQGELPEAGENGEAVADVLRPAIKENLIILADMDQIASETLQGEVDRLPSEILIQEDRFEALKFGTTTLDHLTRAVAACIIDDHQLTGADNRSRVRSQGLLQQRLAVPVQDDCADTHIVDPKRWTTRATCIC